MIDDTLINKIAFFSEQALLYEVTLSPKPGLVDPYSNGAHTDMDFNTFQASIQSLVPFLPQYIKAGFLHEGSLKSLFDSLRSLGYQAEQAMLVTTKGVNTHKGANFSFAVLLGAIGWYLKHHPSQTLPFTQSQTTDILFLAGHLTQHLLSKDFKDLDRKSNKSHGEQLFLTHGRTGIRGEAANGYPSLAHLLLPYVRSKKAHSIDEVFLRALILLMSEIEDGNLLHRGGLKGWEQVRQESKKIHQANFPLEKLVDELTVYNAVLTRRNLSPGGSADLLSLGIFFAQLEGLFSLPLGKKI